ncbi:sodium:solute symporter family protein [Saccharopolyspora sp. 5N708]|uniref:sodium:solute symporter family protein n=1 Tax=Saccharopolyspora sp. 5N708 TaxID=3457424 RepID=UPI003FD0C695
MAILLIMIAFVAVNLAIGFYSARRIKSSDAFMAGEQRMGATVLVFATFATSVGAGDVLTYSSLGYLQGWSSLHFILAMPVVVIIMAFTVGRRYYEMKVTTLSDVLCKVYGESRLMRIVPSIFLSLGMLSWLAGQYSAFGKTLNLMTGANPLLGMVIGAAIFISYTVAGGLVSVMLADVFQGVFLAIGIIVVFVVATSQGGGFIEVQQSLPADYHTFIGASGAVMILMFWMNKGLSRFTNFAYWQRLGSAKNAKAGIWGVSLGMVLTGLLGILLALIGMAAFKISPGGIDDPEMIFLDVSVKYLPTWVGGIVLGALWAAILSSAAGFLNSSATLLGHDIWFKIIKKSRTSPTALLKDLRVITAIIGAGTLVIAWLVPSVLDLLVWAGVWLTPPLIPVLCATVFDRKGTRVPANWLMVSMVCSAAIGFFFEVIPALKSVLSGGTIPAFITSLVIVLLGVAVGRKNPLVGEPATAEHPAVAD